MLTCKFPMLHWDCSFRRPLGKKQQSGQFINCSGSEKGTCGPTNDGPLCKIWKSLEIIHFGFVQSRIPSHGGYHFPIKIATKWWPRSPRMGCQASERDKPQQTISHAAAMSTNYRGTKASRTLMLYRRLLSCKSRLMNWWRWWVGMNLMIIIEMMTTHGPQDVKPSTCRV